MKTLKELSRPMFVAMAATRTSTVLLMPRMVGAESVSVSPTFTPSFLACSSKSSDGVGLGEVVERALAHLHHLAEARLVGAMSMPPMPTCMRAGLG